MMSRKLTLPSVILLLGASLAFFFVTGSVITKGRASIDHAADATQTSPSYVLRAWESDTDRGAYSWSLESDSDNTSPKTLYRSLDSPALRTKVASLSPGTRIVFDFRDGGSLQATDEITGKGYKTFLGFAQFCKSKHIDFKFSMVTN